MDTKYGRLFTEDDVRRIVLECVQEGVSVTETLRQLDGTFKFPTDEPLFLVRGQDTHAVQTIRRYATECNTGGAPKEHVLAANEAATHMAAWQRENPERVKQPS